MALLVVAQSMLVWLTVNYESSRAQEQVDATSSGVATDVKQALSRDLQSLQALLWNDPTSQQWRSDAAVLLRAHRELVRVERRDTVHNITDAVDSPYQGPVFTRIRREDMTWTRRSPARLPFDRRGRCIRAATSCPCPAAWASK
jgi:two-component system sensor histidine kinase DctS